VKFKNKSSGLGDRRDTLLLVFSWCFTLIHGGIPQRCYPPNMEVADNVLLLCARTSRCRPLIPLFARVPQIDTPPYPAPTHFTYASHLVPSRNVLGDFNIDIQVEATSRLFRTCLQVRARCNSEGGKKAAPSGSQSIGEREASCCIRRGRGGHRRATTSCRPEKRSRPYCWQPWRRPRRQYGESNRPGRGKSRRRTRGMHGERTSGRLLGKIGGALASVSGFLVGWSFRLRGLALAVKFLVYSQHLLRIKYRFELSPFLSSGA